MPDHDADLAPLPPDDPWSDEAGPQRREFARADLVTLAQRGIVTPDLMCNELLYPGLVHSIAGPPEAGKTTVALWMAARILETGGTVAMFDEESGPDMTVDKLTALGCGEPDLVNFHYFPFPGRNWNDGDIAELYDLHDRSKPVLSLFDSVGAFMALAGMDENKATDTSRFYMRVLLPLSRSLHSTLLLIDHDTKGSEGGGSNGSGSGSRYARGSGAKLGAIDVMFKVSPLRAFSRSQDGAVILQVTKDRPGWLNPRKYRLDITSHLDVTFTEARGAHGETDTAESGLIKLSPAEQKLMSCVTENQCGVEKMAARVSSKYGHGLRRETVSRGMTHLVELGFAEVVHLGGAGRGDFTTWRKKMPGEQPLIAATDVSPDEKRDEG